MTRTQRLNCVLAVVAAHAPEQLDWVAVQLEQRNETKRRRLDQRDNEIRSAFAMLDMRTSVAARIIETELARHLAAGWLLEVKGEERRPDPPGVAGAVRRIARTNEGKELGVKQLLNVLSGDRTPRK